jgi:hypothetical protein
VDPYLQILAALPRHERYLLVLPLELLTRAELRTVLRTQHEVLQHLDRRLALLRDELRARALAS